MRIDAVVERTGFGDFVQVSVSSGMVLIGLVLLVEKVLDE